MENDLETINQSYHKQLIIDNNSLHECFIKLKDVRQDAPEFKPKHKFLKASQKSPKEYYVKCAEVKESVTEQQWNSIQAKNNVEWYRMYREGGARLIKCNKRVRL